MNRHRSGHKRCGRESRRDGPNIAQVERRESASGAQPWERVGTTKPQMGKLFRERGYRRQTVDSYGFVERSYRILGPSLSVALVAELRLEFANLLFERIDTRLQGVHYNPL